MNTNTTNTNTTNTNTTNTATTPRYNVEFSNGDGVQYTSFAEMTNQHHRRTFALMEILNVTAYNDGSIFTIYDRGDRSSNKTLIYYQQSESGRLKRRFVDYVKTTKPTKLGNKEQEPSLFDVLQDHKDSGFYHWINDTRFDPTRSREYWPCECPAHYIHPATNDWCLFCGATQDKQPNATKEDAANESLRALPEQIATSDKVTQ